MTILYFDFLRNVIEVLFFSTVIILIDLFSQKKYAQHVKGIIFGLITIFIMNDSIMITEGRFFDFRHIIMTMAGFIGGPVTAMIAAIIGSIYRLYLGGSGAMGGISSIIFFGLFGIILARFKRIIPNRNKVLFWFVTGIVIEVAHLSIIAFIHPGNVDSIAVLKIISAPLLIITPLATSIIFNFYYWAYEFFSKSLILNIIINQSDINLMIFDTNGPILNSKNLKAQSEISQELLNPFLLQDKDKTKSNLTKHKHQEITTEDGRSFNVNVFGLQMPSSEPAWVAIVNDITSRKMAEKEISQLVLNLARNGLDAMDERGCMTVQTYLKEDKVILSIEDEGCGISPEDLDKLGTPFYTTKDNGTGMGLATSFKIAESHNAKIDVDSSLRGTKVCISFPIPDKIKDKVKMIV
ncbi:MAG: LytS/YhcK type 5TM receptor domain-containing protein [Bacillota bacterium]